MANEKNIIVGDIYKLNTDFNFPYNNNGTIKSVELKKDEFVLIFGYKVYVEYKDSSLVKPKDSINTFIEVTTPYQTIIYNPQMFQSVTKPHRGGICA